MSEHPMPCMTHYDFISGSRIVLPSVSPERRNEQESWDILRPNDKASVLVARHLEAVTHPASPDKD
jgi:hypothetical protein